MSSAGIRQCGVRPQCGKTTLVTSYLDRESCLASGIRWMTPMRSRDVFLLSPPGGRKSRAAQTTPLPLLTPNTSQMSPDLPDVFPNSIAGCPAVHGRVLTMSPPDSIMLTRVHSSDRMRRSPEGITVALRSRDFLSFASVTSVPAVYAASVTLATSGQFPPEIVRLTRITSLLDFSHASKNDAR